MGKPRMIILIRHAQSEGNKNREIHQSVPDHRVKLTPEGHRQALEAGTRLRALLRPDDKIHFFTSPYRRTRETTEGILQSLTADTPSPSPFPRQTITVYEEPRLREQDFGNFQPCSAEMERMWLERADYGHFFYRIPNGESAADAYDRISGFNESLWRLFGEEDFASVCVLVTHGLMTRVFLMKWYHWSVEYFEDLRNIDHCEFVIMKLNEDSGKYILQNQLRTWSELRREKELERQRERTAKGLAPASPTSSDSPAPVKRKWGGCPDGCNHGLHRKGSLRSSRAHNGENHPRHDKDSQRIHTSHSQSNRENNSTTSSTSVATVSEVQMLTAPEPAMGDYSNDEKPLAHTFPPSTPGPHYRFSGVQTSTHNSSSSEQTAQEQPNNNANNSQNRKPPPRNIHSPEPLPAKRARTRSPAPRRPKLSHFHRDSEDHLLHPPDSKYSLIHLVGRDGGGTLSGATSLVPSEDEQEHQQNPSSSPLRNRPETPNSHQTHHSRPSQDLDNDGDDEGSGKQTPKPRRTRLSHPHSHNRHNNPSTSTPSSRRRNLASKKAANTIPEDTPELLEQNQNTDSLGHSHEHNRDPEGDEYQSDDALEEARREDQSIRGSVY